MGGLVTAYKFDKSDPLISSFSLINSLDVESSLSFYIEEYPNVLRVNYRRFDDIFGGILQDSESSFRFFAGDKTDADLLEIFAVLIIACKGDIRWKVKMLFCLFDFDNSENIDKNEISLVISAFTKALSKLGSGFPPSTNKLFLIASSIFKEIDKDNNASLDINEILEWSEQNIEFQELMAHFSQVQSFELARMRFEGAVKVIEEITVPENVTESFRRKIGFTVLSQLNEAELERFYRSLVTEGFVQREKFLKMARGIAAFIISDYSNQRAIDKGEIQILLSLVNDFEISMLKIEDFMRKVQIPRHDRMGIRQWIEILERNENLIRFKIS